jgi:hypothetical protein
MLSLGVFHTPCVVFSELACRGAAKVIARAIVDSSSDTRTRCVGTRVGNVRRSFKVSSTSR